MKATFFRYALQPLGLAYETRQLSHSDGVDHENDQLKSAGIAFFGKTRWNLTDIRLGAGWYMLEVEHSSSSIGCILTLETPCGDRNALLLTSKSVCKRIVRLDVRLTHGVIQVDQAACSLVRVTFKRISKRFAIDRLCRRLRNRGSGKELDRLEAMDLYDAYRAQFSDGTWPQVYRQEEFASRLANFHHPASDSKVTDIRLILIDVSSDRRECVNQSAEAALQFGRECGWRIEWQLPEEFSAAEPRLSEFRTFFMPILAGAEYRIDVFHHMLGAIEAETHLVYADHDHMDIDGCHVNPVLKPEWNPELLLNTNYILLPWIMSEARGRKTFIDHLRSDTDPGGVLLNACLGKIEDTFDTAAGHKHDTPIQPLSEPHESLFLPALEDVEVKRIPRVLASVRSAVVDKIEPPAVNASTWREHVANALRECGIPADVKQSRYEGGHRIVWPLPAKTPSVDIIIPTRDKASVLETCIDSILAKTNFPNFRIVVVDNDSQEAATQSYYQTLSNDARVTLLRYAGAFNYSAINNFAVAHSKADILLLLNNDTEVRSTGWLDDMVRQAMRPKIGCVGAKLYYTNGRLQHGGVIVGITGVAGHSHRYSPGEAAGYCGRLWVSQNLSAVTAACLAVRRTIWNEVGGLDETYLGVAWNDVDFCLKVDAAGYRNLWTPHAELYHHEGLSRGADDTATKIKRVNAERQIMLDRWKLDQKTDPAYHPLLTRDSESFALGKMIS